MTEDEAKTKWCQFARIAEFSTDRLPVGTYNRLVVDASESAAESCEDKSMLCIGSDCMAWRGYNAPGAVVERRKALPGSTRPAGDDWSYQGDDWTRCELIPSGHCGLAGAP